MKTVIIGSGNGFLSVRCQTITSNNTGLLLIGTKLINNWFHIKHLYELTNTKSFYMRHVSVFVFRNSDASKFEWIFYCIVLENKDLGHNICLCYHNCGKDHKIRWSKSPDSHCWGYYPRTLPCQFWWCAGPSTPAPVPHCNCWSKRSLFDPILHLKKKRDYGSIPCYLIFHQWTLFA